MTVIALQQTQIRVSADPFDFPNCETVRFTMYRRMFGLPSIRPLPKNFTITPWNDRLIPAFTAVLRTSFIANPETETYPFLNSTIGCSRLVEELTDMPGFMPDTTWLIQKDEHPCGVIITNRGTGCVFGQIQLVAVEPRFRHLGLGTNLVRMALWDFNNRSIPHAILHINRTNRRGIRFFRTQGFQVNSSGTYR
jgi:ribosomal protein S18 acetylase RimI-like enzyme